ncbi:hypothetical protein ACOMHN_048633 [Nucella lapillus]
MQLTAVLFVGHKCYNCGEFGTHLAARCPEGPSPKRCHDCKSLEHLIADCPNRNGLQGARVLRGPGGPGGPVFAGNGPSANDFNGPTGQQAYGLNSLYMTQ